MQVNNLILLLLIFLAAVDSVGSVNLKRNQYVKIEHEQQQQQQQQQIYDYYDRKSEERRQQQAHQQQLMERRQLYEQLKTPTYNWEIFGNPSKSFISGYNIEQYVRNRIFTNDKYNHIDKGTRRGSSSGGGSESKNIALIANEQTTMKYWQLQPNLQQQKPATYENRNFDLQIVKREEQQKQKGYTNAQPRTSKDFRLPCNKNSDCRSIAYFCSNERLCECNQGYYPSVDELYCLGTVGKKCLYDNHCINGAYCKGQKICTCKLEFPNISWDKRSCEENSSQAIKVPLLPLSSVLLSAFLLFCFLHST